MLLIYEKEMHVTMCMGDGNKEEDKSAVIGVTKMDLVN